MSQGQTCSIGLTIWDGIEDPDHLVARADEALYHAKRHGRNRLAVHDGQRVRVSSYEGAGLTDRPVSTGLSATDLDVLIPAS